MNSSGDFSPQFASDLPVEGIAVTSDGQTLYGICENGDLYNVSVATGSISLETNVGTGLDIENLEMLSDTEVAFFPCDSGMTIHIYDINAQSLNSTSLPEVNIGDIETFLFVNKNTTATRNTSWGDVKSMFR